MKFKKNILLASFGLFVLLQVFFIVKRVHNYPFMIYDMYSRPEMKKTEFRDYLVIADKDSLVLSELPMLLEGRIINSLKVYELQLVHGSDRWSPALASRRSRIGSPWWSRRMGTKLSNSAAAVEAYPAWLKTFIERKVVRQPVTSFQVHQRTLDAHTMEVKASHQLIDL